MSIFDLLTCHRRDRCYSLSVARGEAVAVSVAISVAISIALVVLVSGTRAAEKKGCERSDE